MPREHFGNEYWTTLTTAITFNQDTITVADASGFPPVQFRVRIGNEILRVYESLPDLHTFRVERGADGTNPNAHAADSSVSVVNTRDALETFIRDSYTEIPWGLPEEPSLAFNWPASELDYTEDDTLRPHGFFFEVTDEGVPRIGVTIATDPIARWAPEGQLLDGDLIFPGPPYDEGEGKPDYPYGLFGARRIRGDFTSQGSSGPPNEQARTTFLTIHPEGYTVVGAAPTATTDTFAWSGFRAYDTPNFNINSGSYIEIGASRTKTWLETTWRTNTGGSSGTRNGRPFEIRMGSVVVMEFGASTVGGGAIGIGIGRTPHPSLNHLNIAGGINLGPGINGAEAGDLYASGDVLGTSVRWGPGYHRTENIGSFLVDNDSGFYWGVGAVAPPVDGGRYHIVGMRRSDAAEHGYIALDNDAFGNVYVTADGWKDNLGNLRWVRLWNTGNLGGGLTGDGILNGPIGIGPGSNLSGKLPGDLVVERSLTLANEPGAGPGEMATPHGFLRQRGQWHGWEQPNGGTSSLRYGRVGTQTDTAGDGVRGAAWLAYGGFPVDPPAGFPFNRASGEGGLASAWRVGRFSEVDDAPIIAELIYSTSANPLPAKGAWLSAIRVDQTGKVTIGTPGTGGGGGGGGGLEVGGPLTLPGPLTVHRDDDFPSTAQIKVWQEGNGDAVLDVMANTNNALIRMWGTLSNPYFIGVSSEDGELAFGPGSGFPDLSDPSDRRTLRIGPALSVGIGRAPSGNNYDLSTARGLNLGAIIDGAINGEARAVMFTPGVNDGEGMVYRQHVWASSDGDGAVNLNFGTNVYGSDEAELIREDTARPSWYVRMGDQDAFTVLRAAPGESSEWELLLMLDDEGNLTGNNLGTLASFLNVGAALDATLGQIRMLDSLYLAKNTFAPTTDQSIMVEGPTAPGDERTYFPLFRAQSDIYWWFGGPGGANVIEHRVGGGSGAWRVSNAVGDDPLLMINNAGVAIARHQLLVGNFAFTDNAEGDGWIHAQNGIRVGNGSQGVPSYSFRGSGVGSNERLTGFFYDPGSQYIGASVESTAPSTGQHRVMLLGHPYSTIAASLFPLAYDPSNPPPSGANYDIGGMAGAGWKAGFFWDGLSVGARNTYSRPANGQLRVIMDSSYPEGSTPYKANVIASFTDASDIETDAEDFPDYRAEIHIGGRGHPTPPLLKIGTTYQSTIGEGYEQTNAYEGRPTFYFERNRGSVIWGINNERHIHFSESGSVGIGNVTPTENLGDLVIARGLTVGLTNAGAIENGDIVGPAEGEILATSITITGEFIVGTPTGGATTQFNGPLILQNNTGRIQSRARPETGITSGSIWDLMWLGLDNELVVQGVVDNRVHIRTMSSESGTPTEVEALMVWPNGGVTIGTFGEIEPPGQSGLKVAGDFELGGTFTLSDTTRFWANKYGLPTFPAIAAGMSGDAVGRIAMLAGGALAFGDGGGTEGAPIWLAYIDHVSNGKLRADEYFGVNVDPTYRLDVFEQAATVFAGRIRNASAGGNGFIVEAGDTNEEYAFVVRKYNGRPNIDLFPDDDQAPGLLTVFGSGMTGISGGLFVQDPNAADPILQADPGQIVCETILVKQDTRYGYGTGPGGGGTTEVGASGIILGATIPLAIREYTGTSTPGTARNVLWDDSSNRVHFRAVQTVGVNFETNSGVVVARYTTGGFLIGSGTPSTNQGDLTVERGLNVGAGATGAVAGEVNALQITAAEGDFSGDVHIAGNVFASNITDFEVSLVGIPAGSENLPSVAWDGASSTGLYQPSVGTIGVTIGGQQRYHFADTFVVGDVALAPAIASGPFGLTIAGPSADFVVSQSALQNEAAITSTASRSRGSSLMLFTTDPTTSSFETLERSGSIYFGAQKTVQTTPPGSTLLDPVFAAIRSQAASARGETVGGGTRLRNSWGSLSFLARPYTISPAPAVVADMQETMRISAGGVGIGHPGPAKEYWSSVAPNRRQLIINGQVNVIDLGLRVGGSETDQAAAGTVWADTFQSGATAGTRMVLTNQALTALNGASATSYAGLWIYGSAFRTQIYNTAGVFTGIQHLGTEFLVNVARNSILETINAFRISLSGTTPQIRNYGDVFIDRGLNVGSAVTGAVNGEIKASGFFTVGYQATAPATPPGNYLKFWADVRGSMKVTRPSGGEWFLNIGENHAYNSDFDVWQRGTIFAGVTSSQYTADRWYASINIGTFTISQVADRPTATEQGGHFAPWCLRIENTVAVADSTINATPSALVGLRYSWEGRFFHRLIGRPMVASFWAKSNRTITYCATLRTGNFARYFPFNFTIAASGTWQFVWFVIATPPSLTDFNYDHNLGAELWITVAAGSTHKNGNSGLWNIGAAVATSSQGNMLSVVNSYLQIAHVKLESGEVPTPCVGRPFDDDLRHAERYFVKTFPYSVAPVQNVGNTNGALVAVTSNSSSGVSWRLPVEMRTTPSVVVTYNPTSANSNWDNGITAAVMSSSSTSVNISGTLVGSNGVRGSIHASAFADF